MKTNTQIQEAFNAALTAASFGYPIGWPGVEFTPPGDGAWLEVAFFPNQGLDEGLPYNSSVTPMGLFQVSAATRPGSGVIGLEAVADSIRGAFPRGTVITSPVRVSRAPYNMQLIETDDKIFIPVSIPYAG
jgi:hypothetical protein